MDLQTILANIRTRLGIQSLNTLQQQLLQSPDPDNILIAATGTGKTLAFAVRMLTTLTPPDGQVQSVIIAPSRELVIQIARVIQPIASGYKTVALYGGHSMLDEKNSLAPAPDIIIATPGRLLDHLQRANIHISRPRTLVLDEYDKSLELGFENEMKRIISRIGPAQSTILTSATPLLTLPPYLPLTHCRTIQADDAPDPRTRMEIIHVHSYQPDKLQTLTDLLRTFTSTSRTIVFVNHRESAERIYRHLKAQRIDAALYHGALDQQHRATAVDLLSNGSVPVLVATDLAARGLDIHHVDHVVHYHLPVDQQAWTHRNGRTARIENQGEVYIITSDADTIPPYITADRPYNPPTQPEPVQLQSPIATLYIEAGKKEKISRADIVGFLIANAQLSPQEIGHISLYDHHALVAVPRHKLPAITDTIKSQKLKGKRIRITPLLPQ